MEPTIEQQILYEEYRENPVIFKHKLERDINQFLKDQVEKTFKEESSKEQDCE